MRKILSLFVAIIATTTTLWANGVNINGLCYLLSDEGAVVTYTSNETPLSMYFTSSTYSGHVVIPDTVIYGSKKYPVIGIDTYAFYWSNTTSIAIPSTLTYIGSYSFQGSKITSIDIPNNVTFIGAYAFCNCYNLKSVTIPSEIDYFQPHVFTLCDSITSVTWNARNCQKWYFGEQVEEFIFGEDVEVIPSELCENMAKLRELTFSKNVENIGYDAFYGCTGIKKLNWDASKFDIGNYYGRLPFPTDSIESVTFGDNIKEIPAYFCSRMDNLKFVSFSNNLETIGEYAFCSCDSLKTIAFPNSLKTIGGSAFSNCSNLETTSFPNSLKTIGGSAFYGCDSFTSVTFPNSVTDIGSYAFGSNVNKVYISDLEAWCNISFGERWVSTKDDTGYHMYLNGTEITNLVIPNSISNIKKYAFKNCISIASLTTGDNVSSIGYSAFYGCTNLISASIGHNVTSIGSSAFEGCDKLSALTIKNGETEFDKWAFGNCTAIKTLQAPASFFDLYEAMLYYPSHIESVVINGGELSESGLRMLNRSYRTLKILDVSAATNTTLFDEAFKDCYNLDTLRLPKQLERVPYMAVAGCKNLKSIDIPASVEEIDQSAFEDCRSLNTITFGGAASSPARMMTDETSQLKKIGNWAFYNAHQLQHLNIPEGVDEIGDGAFYGCTYLEDLVLPPSTRKIGDNCFALCSKIKKITVTSITPPTIYAKTFYDVNRAIPVYVQDEAVDNYKNDTYWKEFDIRGGATPTNLNQLTDSPTDRITKIIKDGQLYILRNGKTYNAQGGEL